MRPLFGLTQYLNPSSVVVGRGIAGVVLLGSRCFHLHYVSCMSKCHMASQKATEKRAYLESNGVRVRVLQAEGLRHLVLEGS